MRAERFCALCCVVSLLAFECRAMATEEDLKQFVLEAVRHNESLFKNFEVDFTLHWYDPEGKRLEPAGADRFVTEERWHYAREGKKIHGEFGTDWSNGYFESGTQVYDGNLMTFYRRDLSSGLIQSRRQFPTSAVPDRFTNLYRNVGDLTMSEFLQASTIKRVTPYEGRGMRGFLVEVIHKDTSPDNPLEQKIYLDADKGMVPVVVETYRLALSSEQAVLIDEVLEFEQVAPEIYFPKKGRLLWYSPEKNADSGQPKKLLLEDEVRVDVSRIRVNADLPAAMFRLDYPPGTNVYDETLDLSYRVGVAQEHLSELDRIVKEEFKSSRGDANVTHAESTEVNKTANGHETGAERARGNLLGVSPLSSRIYLLIVVLMAALILTGALVLRRQRKR